MSARLLNDIGLRFNPASAWVVDKSSLWVASRVIPGALDVGPYVLAAATEQARKPGIVAAMITMELTRYNELKDKVAALRASDPIRPLLEQFPKGGFERLSPADHQALQPLRDASRQMLQLQERMIDLLPQGAALRSNLLMASYAGEVVAEWDFLNQDRFNTMVCEQAGRISVQTVDRGVSGPVGFGGGFMRDSAHQANQPARVSDPYAITEGAGAPYPSALFSPRDMDFATASPSVGLIGDVPRSASSAFIFRDVVPNERENLQADTGPGPRQVLVSPAGQPTEAMQVAWLLKHNAKPHQVSESIAAVFDECRKHPVTRAMLHPSVTGAEDADALAAIYSKRIGSIIERAEQGDALNRWANTHRSQARSILLDKELTGPL
ncbi:hypothetical protein [Herbaspirillum sp. YR522]|uniref:hypothetical protein n=1 Tax=Herbaspirillum sp. YR522 TaxID=1144342 RepID=UPI00026FCDA6|nr:hypothetical protein [Herbaspirillum sp. YR522]EJM97634.1 hypothetical protein PMI40_04302 [Herbaspirillum sp. YR522]